MCKLKYLYTYAPSSRMAVDLRLSENPFGPSPQVLVALTSSMEHAHRYPHDEEALVARLATHHQVQEESILLGAGANGLLEEWLRLLAKGKNIVVPSATFPESVQGMKKIGDVKRVPLRHDGSIDLEGMLAAVDEKTAAIHLCNPNNPTGIWNDLREWCHTSPVPLLISEANVEFVNKSLLDAPLPKNVIVVRSFSKAYGLAGLRIGYSVASPALTAALSTQLRSYRVSSMALTAAHAALDDQDYLATTITAILQEKKWLVDQMKSLGFTILPSQGQTFIAEVPSAFKDAKAFCEELSKWNAAVVDCGLFEGLERYVRLSPQTPQLNQKFIQILNQIRRST